MQRSLPPGAPSRRWSKTRPLSLLLAVWTAMALGWACSSANAGSATAKARALAPSAHPSPLGTNLAPLVDWGTEHPFVDWMKQSRALISSSAGTWDDGRKINVDADGWPTSLLPGQIARILVAWDVPTPQVEFVVTWQGKGTLNLEPQLPTSMTPGRATFVSNGQNIGVNITETDPKDPIRNIRVVEKTLEQHTSAFHPAFVASLKPFSVVRFMDWMKANEPAFSSWKDRATPTSRSYATYGVPAEIMVALCNELGTDAWFSLPHTWDDATVREFAKVVHRDLKPTLRAFVEHSNEVWNNQFPQARYADGRGGVLSKDAFQGRLRFHSQRSVAIFSIFTDVFKAQPQRVVRVMGSMAANAWVTEQLLEWKDAYKVTDAVAIAPYFGGSLGDPSERERARSLDSADMKLALEKSLIEVEGWLDAQQAMLKRFGGAPLIAYEGGQHLVGVGESQNDDQLTHVFLRTNEDPMLKQVYLRYLTSWKNKGGQLFVHYTSTMRPTKFGAWGSRPDLDTPRDKAPKWDALLTFTETTPRWW